MTNSNIHTNIKLRRKTARVSQNTLAKMTGLDFSTISLIERKKRDPRSYNLSRIDKALLDAQAFLDEYGIPYGKKCPGDVKNNVGARIRYLRLKKGLTRKQLSNILGIHESHMQRVETNGLIPKIMTIKKITKISKALNCLADDLLIEDTSKAGIDWDNLALKLAVSM